MNVLGNSVPDPASAPPSPGGRVPISTAPAAAPALAGPRFCSGCGAPWNPVWAVCPSCEARRQKAAETPPAGSSSSNAPITSGLCLYFAFLGTSAAGIIAISAGASVVPTEFVLSAAISIVVAAWCLAGRAQVWPGLVCRPHLKWFAAAACGSLVTFTAASAALAVLKTLLGIPQIQMTSPFTAAGFGPAVVILLVAVQPGIFEELAFRGVILGGLQHVLSPVEAIVVSAAMFMIIHLSVPSFPHLFLIGLALGWLRVQSGSLYPGMLLHFLHNLYCVLWEYARPLHS